MEVIHASQFCINGEERIKLEFEFNWNTLSKIKRIPGRRYNSSERYWHIPNYQTSLVALQQLKVIHKEIDLVNINTPPLHRDDNSFKEINDYQPEHVPSAKKLSLSTDSDKIALGPISGTGQAAQKTSANTGIVLPPGEAHSRRETKDSGKFQENIRPNDSNQLVRSILFSGGVFFINIKYDKSEVVFLKKLDACYWHAKKQGWICAGNLKNHQRIQARYQYWDEKKDGQLTDILGKMEKAPKVKLEINPENEDTLFVSFSGSYRVPDFIKCSPGRTYHKEGNKWEIRRSFLSKKDIVRQLLDDGWDVHDYLPDQFSDIAYNSAPRTNYLQMYFFPEISGQAIFWFISSLFDQSRSYGYVPSSRLDMSQNILN